MKNIIKSRVARIRGKSMRMLLSEVNRESGETVYQPEFAQILNGKIVSPRSEAIKKYADKILSAWEEEL
ncbi:MAG TPA: hypothetical protein PKL77_06170 [Candidatus Omnitrophota bacterium]|nr:hypothetical protein [Candidatus Omnitrophota bacterium]